MPKVTIEFNLPEEVSEYKLVHKAGGMHSALFDLANYMRELTKYTEHKGRTSESVAEDVKDRFWEILNEYDIDPYEE